MSGLYVIAFLACYLGAFLLDWRRTVRRSGSTRALALGCATAGWIVHTAYLLVRSRMTDLPPLLSSSHDWLLVLAWVAVLLYLTLSLLDRKLALGPFLWPVVLLLCGSTFFVSDRPNRLLDAQRGWKMLHASLLVFGVTGVIVGFTTSLMYLVQHRRLKRKQAASEGFLLPSLERLARLNWWAVVASVPLLTLGMLTGIGLGLVSREGPDPVSLADPFVIANGIVWVLMVAFFIWLVVTRRQPARQMAWMTLWAFGFLLVTLVTLQVLSGGGIRLLDSWHAARPADALPDAT